VSIGTWLAAAGLGGVGAVLRFLVDAGVSRRFERDFPYGTLAVNLSGAVLLGLTVGLALRGNAALLVGSATIGAYTTFSTWMFETHRLAEVGELTRAAANAFLSLGLGLAAAALGRLIGMHL
jgi:fluoride exporter